jgi:hypothetical protein
MTALRLVGAALGGVCVLFCAGRAAAQDASADDAPTAPTVPPTAQIATNPMPVRRAELDKAAARSDFAAVQAIVAAAASADEVDRNMAWEELQVVQGASVYFSLRYMDDLWFRVSSLPDGPTTQSVRRFAGVVGLYALQQIEIDGPRCADPSAPGHRLDQLTQGRGPVWQYVLALPEVTRRDLAVEALKLEARTAGLRRDDPVLCSGGAADLARALHDDKTELGAGSGGHRDVEIAPVATYVDPALSTPKQAQRRAGMPMMLAHALKLPEAKPN